MHDVNKLAEVVLDAAFRIHRATGPGLMESFYERVLARDLARSGYDVERQILPVHTKQLLTYLRLQDQKLGLLLNFGAPYMKDGIKRVVNGL